MHFGEPSIFFWLFSIPVLIFVFIAGWRLRRKTESKLGDKSLIKRLKRTGALERRFLKALFILLAITLIIVSLTKPRWGKGMRKVSTEGVDIVFALDISKSMLAEDIKPNRLKRAKIEMENFIDNLKGNNIGLVCFAGSAHIQCPLTVDYSAASMFLDAANTSMITQTGTSLGDAIRTSVSVFKGKKESSKVIVLLTDGEDHGSDPIDAARKAKEKNIVIHTVGIGAKRGEPIPIRDSNGNLKRYKKDKNGEIIMTRMNSDILSEIASVTGGIFIAAENSVELESVFNKISQMEKSKLKTKMKVTYYERFQWFLFPALVFLLLAFLTPKGKRRG